MDSPSAESSSSVLVGSPTTGKKRRERRKAFTEEEDVVILRAIARVDPQNAPHGQGKRRWQEAAAMVATEIEDEKMTDVLCKGRYENMLKRFELVLAGRHKRDWPKDPVLKKLLEEAMEWRPKTLAIKAEKYADPEEVERRRKRSTKYYPHDEDESSALVAKRLRRLRDPSASASVSSAQSESEDEDMDKGDAEERLRALSNVVARQLHGNATTTASKEDAKPSSAVSGQASTNNVSTAATTGPAQGNGPVIKPQPGALGSTAATGKGAAPAPSPLSAASDSFLAFHAAATTGPATSMPTTKAPVAEKTPVQANPPSRPTPAQAASPASASTTAKPATSRTSSTATTQSSVAAPAAAKTTAPSSTSATRPASASGTTSTPTTATPSSVPFRLAAVQSALSTPRPPQWLVNASMAAFAAAGMRAAANPSTPRTTTSTALAPKLAKGTTALNAVRVTTTAAQSVKQSASSSVTSTRTPAQAASVKPPADTTAASRSRGTNSSQVESTTRNVTHSVPASSSTGAARLVATLSTPLGVNITHNMSSTRPAILNRTSPQTSRQSDPTPQNASPVAPWLSLSAPSSRATTSSSTTTSTTCPATQSPASAGKGTEVFSKSLVGSSVLNHAAAVAASRSSVASSAGSPATTAASVVAPTSRPITASSTATPALTTSSVTAAATRPNAASSTAACPSMLTATLSSRATTVPSTATSATLKTASSSQPMIRHYRQLGRSADVTIEIRPRANGTPSPPVTSATEKSLSSSAQTSAVSASQQKMTLQTVQTMATARTPVPAPALAPVCTSPVRSTPNQTKPSTDATKPAASNGPSSSDSSFASEPITLEVPESPVQPSHRRSSSVASAQTGLTDSPLEIGPSQGDATMSDRRSMVRSTMIGVAERLAEMERLWYEDARQQRALQEKQLQLAASKTEGGTGGSAGIHLEFVKADVDSLKMSSESTRNAQLELESQVTALQIVLKDSDCQRVELEEELATVAAQLKETEDERVQLKTQVNSLSAAFEVGEKQRIELQSNVQSLSDVLKEVVTVATVLKDVQQAQASAKEEVANLRETYSGRLRKVEQEQARFNLAMGVEVDKLYSMLANERRQREALEAQLATVRSTIRNEANDLRRVVEDERASRTQQYESLVLNIKDALGADDA